MRTAIRLLQRIKNGSMGEKSERLYEKDLLFSLCGLNSGLCSMHLDSDCPGYGGGEGNQSCKIAKCSLQHEALEYCSRCQEFPCENYEGVDEFDSFITHRNRMEDFERFRGIGTAAYRAEQKEKVEILKFLLENYNDGRKKTFFCLVVNLLELPDLKAGLRQLESVEEVENLKEKSAGAVKLFQAMAEQR